MMSAAFWNGFPFIYSDIGTYLGSGFTPEMPIDRPITYGLFIFGASLGGISIWLIIFLQAFLMAFTIRLTLIFFTGERKKNPIFISTIALLTILTSTSFLVGQLMPDFSTSIMLLCLILLIVQAPLSIKTRRCVFSLFFLTNALHISHILLNIVLLSGLLLFYFFYQKGFIFLNVKTLLKLFLLTILGTLTMLPPLSKSSHVFRMGSLVHNHILQTYLTDNCQTKSLKLCSCKNDIPDSFDAFVWDAKSPLNKIGWKESKKEYQQIINDIYTTRKYLIMITQKSLFNTWLQLSLNNVGEGNIKYSVDAPYIKPLETYLKALPQYIQSRQFNSDTLIPYGFHIYHKTIIIISLFLFLILSIKAWKTNQISSSCRFFLIFLIISILINAWIAATFVYPHNRAGCKLIWFLPFMVILLLSNQLVQKVPALKTEIG